MTAARTFKKQGLDLPGPLHVFDEVTSTNNLAAEAGRNGADPYTCFFAEVQTAGRGRDGRAWRTFPYTSLAFSVVIYEANDVLPLVASLSVAEAMQEVTGLPLEIKWPNDLQLKGEKIGGVLTERYNAPKGAFYVVGIGVNINMPLEVPPVGLSFSTIEMHLGKPVSREKALEHILWHLKRDVTQTLVKGFGTMADRYRTLCNSLGKQVTWRGPQTSITGMAVSLDGQGALVLDTAEGVRVCRAGDIIQEKT